MLSYSCKTAIKAVIFLASRFDSDSRESLRTVADEIDASEHTVGKLMQLLVKQDIVNSIKGPHGGFFLDKKQMNQSVIQIIYAVDGKDVFKECGLGLNKCSEKHPCPIHFEYKKSRDIAENLFRTRRVGELSMEVLAGNSFLCST